MEEREAIARIKASRDYRYSHYDYVDDTGKAFDMAIRALEKQGSEKRKSERSMQGNLVTNVFFESGKSIPYILCPDEAEYYYCFEDFSEGNGVYEVDPSTICRCTGLKDKNGKLIWENDIVAFLDTYSTESGLAEASCKGKVVWDDETLSFQVTGRLSAESYEVLDDCCVIGNIFDNPDLLEMEV